MSKWKQVGKLYKTKRNGMLRGEIFIEDLDLKINVIAFLRTKDQKKSGKEEDISILYVENQIQEINLFD